MSRPGPSRANRVARRAADRTARGDTTVMRVPRHLTTGGGPRHLPCPIDPTCPVDHLNRRRGGGRRG